MKVQYKQSYTDEFGHKFQPGWVAEHTDAEAERRIALGVCLRVSNDARTFQLKPAKTAVTECVPESAPQGSELKKK